MHLLLQFKFPFFYSIRSTNCNELPMKILFFSAEIHLPKNKHLSFKLEKLISLLFSLPKHL